MAQLGGSFDPGQVPADERSFDLIPSGPQPMQIVESDLVKTKDGTGQMLNLTWQIIDGQFINRKVWQRLNIQNKSPEAQAIGERQLADICEATGAGAIQDSEELHFKPCLVTIGIEKDKSGEYPDKNKVTRVKPLAGQPARQQQATRAAATTQRQAAQPAQQPQKAAAGGGSRPWNR